MVIHAMSHTSLLHVLCFYWLPGVPRISRKAWGNDTSNPTRSVHSAILPWSTASLHMLKMSDIHGLQKCCSEACPGSHVY